MLRRLFLSSFHTEIPLELPPARCGGGVLMVGVLSMPIRSACVKGLGVAPPACSRDAPDDVCGRTRARSECALFRDLYRVVWAILGKAEVGRRCLVPSMGCEKAQAKKNASIASVLT